MLRELVNSAPFHALFKGNEKVQMTAVSSADLVAVVGKNTTLYDLMLVTLRKCRIS